MCCHVCRPIGYLKHLLELIELYKAQGRDPHSVFAIMLDSDTLWSVTNVDVLWAKFDMVREQKQLVVSTEMNCWVCP